jgi:hypothetical protein
LEKGTAHCFETLQVEVRVLDFEAEVDSLDVRRPMKQVCFLIA